MDESCKVQGGDLTYKRRMQILGDTGLSAAEEVILKAKLASGVWPPPGAVEEMMNAILPCVSIVKELVTFVKEATKAVRKTENEERKKMERFMNEWVQNQRVRDLFTQWEKIQIQTLKSDQETELNYDKLSPEETRILEDGNDGLIIDTTTSKHIIKAGRLSKLIERTTCRS